MARLLRIILAMAFIVWISPCSTIDPKIEKACARRPPKYWNEEIEDYPDFYFSTNHARKKSFFKKLAYPIKAIDAHLDKVVLRNMMPELEDPDEIPHTRWGHFCRFVGDNLIFAIAILFIVAGLLVIYLTDLERFIKSLVFSCAISVPIFLALIVFKKVLKVNYMYKLGLEEYY
ncbi:conserved Plasmodium protein, unknown function [Plasmodium knowlesi strain H]|uniref:Uncharacterized protein n=3 Tax=Plasmodium knowlesi TaxID=5850 RepID=A0A5K1UGD9_PLAKH|nr:conserved Plasmodium protein, unknown function [Plasmodium knowlesi strain H]OTN64304.1 Uncharacterized protein PKNOH_S140219000 [Plasmodium knowlesi]CAA9990618.1 conserved Plasmodium protein, unknown function [Plasmodium knowlesi strain H]SBO26046.1 conserved Plasmodium protein, unknown function [Plasmodium knowlesi strain H]SBO28740.1 conserved Plasmodium protein, unknown function [Plasmodium knowlesi strain H]VVS80092.1 conserved Plasmodium protein, unknown function [Plasmodium knowlesi |eukprot:XP_002261910.1 hypothetical protein, conserved in Plasmodium species [Plasmodium knowlesi strain H]